MCEVQQELERLKSVFESIGQDIHLQAPATDSLINSIEAATGVAVDDRLKAFWRLSNGSDRTRWFGHPGEIVYGEDESEEGVTCLLEEGVTKEMAAQWPADFTGHYFLSVEDVLKNWSV